MTPIETYIRERAPAYNVDPDIAVRVALSEGGVTDPVRQSGVVKNGVREQSYGPFQLYMGGGLGNRALEAGIDPRDPNQWKQGVDFALAEAGKKGWGQWHGAAKAGIGDMQGIGGYTGAGPTGGPGLSLDSNPVAAAAAPTPTPETGLSGILNSDAFKSIAGAAGGGGGGEPAMMELTPPAIQAHTGSEGAAQLMAQLLANRRNRYGLSLTGMG